LNIVAIGLGVALMFVCLGWVQGYSTYIYRAVITMQTGAAQILANGYLEESARCPLDLTVKGYSTLRRDLLTAREVSGVSGRIDFPLRIIAASGSVRLLGQGIDAKAESGVTTIAGKVVEGRYLDDRPGLLLGKTLAAKLGVGPGTSVIVSATDRYGVENRIALPIVGLLSFGYSAMDDYLAWMDLASAQNLLDLGDEVTRIVVAGPDAAKSLRAVQAFVSMVGGKEVDGSSVAGGLKAYGWQEFAKATVSGVSTDSESFYIVAIILFGLIIVGILNSMSMSVEERHREIAALRAIGFRRRDARKMILLESVALAIIGVLAGLIIAAPIVYWLGVVGVDIAAMIPKDFPVPFGEIYHADYRFWHLLLSLGLGIAASVAGALTPASRAAKLPIAETIGAGL
jgi:putative ABC transport system permease protein